MNTLEMKEASIDDLHTLSEMERTIFDYDIITRERMKYLLTSKTAIVIKATRSRLMVGYMILFTRRNSRILRIYSLGISKQQRRLGLGRKLLKHAEDCAAERGCKHIHLELRTDNNPALIFYLSEGFCIHGHRENYYTDGSQALLLRKPVLPGESL